MTLGNRAKLVWGNDGLEKLDCRNLEKFNFSSSDLEILCKVGLPSWCAPNIHLHPIESFASFYDIKDYITIGSDRDNNDIELAIADGKIRSSNGKGKVLIIANSIEEFFELLLIYAEFIDKYINDNPGFNFSNTFPEVKAIHVLINDMERITPNLMQTHEWWGLHLNKLIKQDQKYFD